jgi:hypothetical protein
MRITDLNTVELEQHPGALAPKYSEAVLETDSDIAP